MKPGLTATITIYTLEEDDVLSVPTKALRFNPDPEIMKSLGITVEGEAAGSDSTKNIWVRNGDTIRPVQVVAGNTSGDRTGISGPLKDGDEVITGLTAEPQDKQKTVERSPFAPGPRGGQAKR